MTSEGRKNAYLYCKFRDEQWALYNDFAKANGMFMNTFLVYNALFYAEYYKDGMTQKKICEIAHLSKQTISLIMKNLLKEGHVIMEENPDDRRNKLIRLTDKGREYCRNPVRCITNAEDTAMAMFSPDKQKEFIDLMREFTENLNGLVWKDMAKWSSDSEQ